MSFVLGSPLTVVAAVAAPGVVVDQAGTETHTGAATSASYSTLTVGTGSHRALVLCIIFGYATTAPTGVTATWDSGGTNQAMTQIVAQNAAASAAAYLFGLVAPTSGNKTLAMSWTNSAETFVAAVSFTGVDQTGGATSFPHSASNANGTVPITSATGNYVMGCGGYGATASEPISGTPLFNDHSSGAFINAAAMYTPGAATFTVQMTSGGVHALVPGVGTDILAG